jgi:protein SCO1/2
MRRSLLACLAVLSLPALVACGGGGSGSDPAATHTHKAGPAHYAAPGQASPPRPAPDFALRNSLGRTVRLSQFRGKAVLLTFIYDHCPDTCPLIVGNLHASLLQLGPRASKLQIVAVSVDPRGDTPKTVKRFLALHDMTGRMEYLIGTKRELAPVWRKWGISVQGTPDDREVSHSAQVFGITGSGRAATLYPANFKPRWIVHDVPVLAAH